MSLLIRGGTMINHDHSRRADVLIDGETIAAVGASINPAINTNRRLGLKGLDSVRITVVLRDKLLDVERALGERPGRRSDRARVPRTAATRTQRRRYRGPAPDLPSREAVIGIVEDLVAALYPRHFGPQGLSAAEIDAFVARTRAKARLCFCCYRRLTAWDDGNERRKGASVLFI